MISNMETSKYQPASRQVRDNITTQDNFAQAAFWSREYQLNPADLEASIKLASSVRKMGNASKAVEITQTTRALHPNDPYLAAEYAAALIATERGDEAIGALDSALRAAPGYARLWSLKGAALDQMENYDLARRHYARALQITPQDPNIMTNMGLSYALAGDPRQAEAWLRKAVAQPTANANTRQTLDMILQLQGKQTAPALRRNEGEAPSLSQFETFKDAPQRRAPAYGQRPQAQEPGYAQQPQRQAYAQPPNANYSQGYHQSRAQQPAQQNYQYQQPQAQPKASRAPHQGYAPQSRQPTPNQSQQNRPPARQSGQHPQQHSTYQAPGHRSNMTVVGGQAGAPQSASEMARSIAQKSQTQNRRVVAPVSAMPKTQEQTNILDQIANNIGPRPTTQRPMAAPQSYPERAAVEDYPPPETLPRRRMPYPQNMAPPQSYPGYAPNQYQPQPSAQQPQQRPTSRGAARERR